jgi:hypothetical protein
VNDDWGSSWSRHVDVTADAAGAITDQFNLPNWFVASYSVTATGSSSGVATTTFTDGSVRVKTIGGTSSQSTIGWVLYNSTDCTGVPAASGSESASRSGNGSDIGSGATSTQSLLLTASATLDGAPFQEWSSAANFSDAEANPTCLSGVNPTQNKEVRYATNRTTTTGLARTTGTSPTAYGNALTFTATVTASGGNPSGIGNVTFKDGATVVCSAVPLSGNQATCSPILDTGSHSLTAEYSGGVGGSINFLSSVSSAVNQSITTRPVTVKANNVSRTYGDSTPAFSITLASGTLAAGDSLASLGTPTFGFDNVGDGVNVGSYRINVSGLANGNYAISYATGSNRGLLTIEPATLTVTANDKSRDYGDSNPLFDATITGFKNGETLATSGVTGSPSCTTTATSASGVGTYPIACALGTLAATNYDFSFVAGTLTIEPVALTVTADAVPSTAAIDHFTRPYDQPDPVFTVRYDGFVNGDDPADLGGTLSITTTALTFSPIGAYPVTPFGLTSINYAITFVAGTLDITTAFRIIGFDSPVDMTVVGSPKIWNSVKNGQTVPLKFRVFNLDGSEVTSLTDLSAMARTIGCTSGYVEIELMPIVSTAETGLRRTGDRFHFNWAVPKTAGKCYQVLIKTVDGSTTMVGSMSGTPVQEAYFKSK